MGAKTAQKPVLRDLLISEIDPSEIELREKIDTEALEELSETITDFGIMSPILVTARHGHRRYILIAGGRRLRGAKQAGEKTIPAFIYDDVVGAKALEMALVENLQRDNLEPMWEARAIRIFQTEYRYSEDRIAQRLKKKPSFIRARLSLLALPLDIQQQVEEKTLDTSKAVIISTKVKGSDAQRAMVEKVRETNIPYPVVKRIVEEAQDEARQKKRVEKMQRRQLETTRHRGPIRPVLKAAPRPIALPPQQPENVVRSLSATPVRLPGKIAKPAESSPYLPASQADLKIQQLVLKGEEVRNALLGIALDRFDDASLKKLRQAVSAITQELHRQGVRIEQVLDVRSV